MTFSKEETDAIMKIAHLFVVHGWVRDVLSSDGDRVLAADVAMNLEINPATMEAIIEKLEYMYGI